MTYRIMLADHQPLMRDCVRKILAEGKDLEVVADDSADGWALLELLEKRPDLPDMVIMDATMSRLEGIEATRRISRLYPRIKVLVLTVHKEEEYANEAMKAGAAGYVIKEEAWDELISAVGRIRGGKTYISANLSRAGLDAAAPPQGAA